MKTDRADITTHQIGGMSDEGMTAAEFYRFRERTRPSRYVAALASALAALPEPRAALDVGCGPGFTLQHLSRRVSAAEFTGCDTDSEILRMARTRCGTIKWAQNEPGSLPFPDEAFSLVFTEYSAHHFADPGKMISEMWRVLRPGGRLMVIDVNPRSPVSRLFTAYVRMKDLVGAVSKIDSAIALSIKRGLPVERFMKILKETGITAGEKSSLLSVCYEAEKQ